MFAKIFLVSLCFFTFALIKDNNAVPAHSFNFSHFNDQGSFHASYISKNDTAIEESKKIRDEDLVEPLQMPQRLINANHTDKIYGGSNAALGQFPFMVIIHRLAGNGKFFVCGGSILSKRWVLTAGHCVAKKPQKFLVVFGVVNKAGIGYDSTTGNGISMIATQGALHPAYGLGDNDIGLLYMPRDIPFSETVQPIRLAGTSYSRETFVDKIANIYGWGKVWHNGAAAQHLQYGRVTIVSNSECRLTWNVDSSQICTESSIGQDVCQGDSGGPLAILEEDDEPVQIGIVSYGDAGCPSNRPSVFTRVSAYLTWIKKITGIHYE